MEQASVFENEGDFCSNCGAILLLDHAKLNALCVVCNNKTSLKKMIGMKYHYTIDFTPLNYHAEANLNKKKKAKAEESVGQMDNERECHKCGHKGMTYTTMQLRSADEGQTIFYFCPQCRNREVEDS